MNTKTMVAGVLGGICYFLLGWLIWGILLKDTMNMDNGVAQNVMRNEDDILMWALIVGHMAYAFGLAYIIGNWSGATTFGGGAKVGALVAFLFALGLDLIYLGTSNIMTMNGIMMDAVVSTVMGAITGGVIGWWIGRSN